MKNINKGAVQEIIAQILELEKDEVDLDAALIDDLGAESLDLVDITFTLGKRLGIRLPTKTTLIMAEDILHETAKLTERGRLTRIGALFLQDGPNKYPAIIAKEGAAVDHIMSCTTVENWFNLCQFIANHPSRSGDTAIAEYIHEFSKKYELTAAA